MLKRDHGGLGFATLRDGSGDLQVMVDADVVGAEAARPVASRRRPRRPRRRHRRGGHHPARASCRCDAESLQLTSKSLRPLPDKHKGLTDPEARVRQRYVDLIVRPEARDMAYIRVDRRAQRPRLAPRRAASSRSRHRSCSWSTAARTPGRSRPTSTPTTSICSSGSPPSCISSGCSSAGWRRSSRSAGSSATRASDFKHNPEFTSLEVYETYGDYDTMRVLTQEIIQEAATAVYGAPVARRRDADGTIVEYDLSGDWPVKTICEAVSEELGEEVTADTPWQTLLRHAEPDRARPRPGGRLGLRARGDLRRAVREHRRRRRSSTPTSRRRTLR